MAYTQSDLAQAWMNPRPDVMGAAFDLSVMAEAAQSDPAFGRLTDAIGMGPAKLAVLTSGFRALEPDYLKHTPIQPDETKAAEARGAIYRIVSGMTTGLGANDISRIAGAIYDGMSRALQASVTATGLPSAEMCQVVAAELCKTVPPEHLRNSRGHSGSHLEMAKAFYDELGRTPLDRLIVGNRIAGFYSGTTVYSGLAGTHFDPSRGISSLTPQNFDSSPFKAMGLDYATTTRLALEGFSPHAILAAANLTRQLGIDLNQHVGSVARLTQHVSGIGQSLQAIKDLKDAESAAKEHARQARERGDHAAAAEHEREAEEARKKREELVAKERERIREQNGNNPGLVRDFDTVIGAMEGERTKLEKDVKAGRITQEQADAKQQALLDQTTEARTAKRETLVRSEANAASNPNSAPPQRETEVVKVETEVVKPDGRATTYHSVADAFGDGGPPQEPRRRPGGPSPS